MAVERGPEVHAGHLEIRVVGPEGPREHLQRLLLESDRDEEVALGRDRVRVRPVAAREPGRCPSLVEERGFTVCDDLMHGFGGGYFPPILGTRSRPAGPLPKMTLEENMTVVIQPNVIARRGENESPAGVQVGELIRVTRTGFEPLHKAPRGFFRA